MIYVMSDIHGNEERFNSVMKQINLQADDTLYVLGDVIDRNNGSIRILRKLMKMPNAQMLLGNHEYMMLAAIDSITNADKNWIKNCYSRELLLWYNNGGDITHHCFKYLPKDKRKEILDYVRKLPINLETTVNGVNFKLCHASPLENWEKNTSNQWLFDSKEEFAVWNRWQSSDGVPEGFTLIFGHTPTCYLQGAYPWKIYKSNNAIGIDCGSAYDEGRLACLRLDDMKEFYSS